MCGRFLHVQMRAQPCDQVRAQAPVSHASLAQGRQVPAAIARAVALILYRVLCRMAALLFRPYAGPEPSHTVSTLLLQLLLRLLLPSSWDAARVRRPPNGEGLTSSPDIGKQWLRAVWCFLLYPTTSEALSLILFSHLATPLSYSPLSSAPCHIPLPPPLALAGGPACPHGAAPHAHHSAPRRLWPASCAGEGPGGRGRPGEKVAMAGQRALQGLPHLRWVHHR